MKKHVKDYEAEELVKNLYYYMRAVQAEEVHKLDPEVLASFLSEVYNCGYRKGHQDLVDFINLYGNARSF